MDDSSTAEATARTLDAAVAAAAAKLGLSTDQVDAEVLQQPEPARFGYLGRPATVRVRPRTIATGAPVASPPSGAPAAPGAAPPRRADRPETALGSSGPTDHSGPETSLAGGSSRARDVPEPEAGSHQADLPARPRQVDESRRASSSGTEGEPGLGSAGETDGEPRSAAADEDVELAADFIEGLLDVLDLDADITTWTDASGGHVDVTGSELGALIGRAGDTLSALQDLMRIAVAKHGRHRPRVSLDIGGYRAGQREQLEADAIAVARRVVSTGAPERMRPMGAYERKVVHDAVIKVAGARTVSEGEEPNRHVVVEPIP